jgi:N-acetylmuramoyl-L-alanine amidase
MAAAGAFLTLATGSTGATAQVSSAAVPVSAPAASTAYQRAIATPVGNTAMPQPARSVTIALPAPGPAPTLAQVVESQKVGTPLGEQANCLATAVYFESRGESLEGQLAVAHVVMNRASSGQYPTSWCEVVKQKAQFSFVRHGSWPAIRDIESWRTAEAIARIAIANAVPSIPNDVLWYHANYVSPSWGSRLSQVQQIGVHIFYRA